MTPRKPALLCLVIAIVSTLVACGGSGSTSTPPKVVTIALPSGLPTSVGVSTGLQMAATVTNDSATGGGADWSATCGSEDCGTFSATHTASGTATTYTSPATVPTGNTVAVTATSSKDSTKTASATFSIAAAPAIAVSFQAPPPISLSTSGTTATTANVTNDSANAGVDWSITCGSNDCGSLSPTHTASGATATYTAPAAVPAGGKVTLVATSTADATKSASASIGISVPITSYNQLLNGTYAFQISGAVQSFGGYQVAGAIVADGNGTITGGEQVYIDGNTFMPGSILGGSYSFGSDGRGTITLNTSSTSIAVAGVETLGAVIVSGSHALLSEFDFSATARGSMDLQTAVHPLNGGYAFVMGGNFPIALGGVFNVDNSPAAGDISGAGSVVDLDNSGSISSGSVAGSVSAPDSFGQVTILTNFDNITMTGFIVDDAHIKVIATAHSEAIGGVAIAQGSAAGTYVDNSAFSGRLVYGVLGECNQGDFGTAIAGWLTSDGAGNLSGFMDASFGAVDVTSDNFTGTYTVDGTGTGRVSVETSIGNLTPGPNFIFYLTQPSLPPLAMEIDDFSAATGSASMQSAGPYALSGAYGLDFTTFSGTESDGTAQIAANGNGTFTGNADVNSNLTNLPIADLPFSGTVTPDPSGRFDATVTLNNGITYDAAFYFIDSTQGFLVENDSQNVTFGVFQVQQQISPGLGRGKLATARVHPRN